MQVHKLFNGKISSAKFYKSFKVNKIEIKRSAKRGIFHVDGEPRFGDANINIQVIEKALKVCV